MCITAQILQDSKKSSGSVVKYLNYDQRVASLRPIGVTVLYSRAKNFILEGKIEKVFSGT